MQEIAVNWMAFIAAIVVKQALGALWFSPMAFGKTYAVLNGVSDEDMRARLPRVVPVEIVGALIMGFVLVHAVRYAGADGFAQGAAVGFLNWLGFVAVSALNAVLYAKRSIAVYLIEMGYWLVALVAMGAILGGWR